MTVHHVHVHPVGAAIHHPRDFIRESREVSAEDGGNDADFGHGAPATVRSMVVPADALLFATGD